MLPSRRDWQAHRRMPLMTYMEGQKPKGVRVLSGGSRRGTVDVAGAVPRKIQKPASIVATSSNPNVIHR